MNEITLGDFVKTVDGEGLEYAVLHYYDPFSIKDEPELTKKINQFRQLYDEIDFLIPTTENSFNDY
jgi:hypothetical protein